VSNLKAELLRILQEAEKLGGRVIVPAFSLGRTQQLVYFLNDLFNTGQLPTLPVFVDSPLSLRLTRVYRNHLQILDDDVQEVLTHDADPFGFPWLHYIQSMQESKALNQREGAVMIISASGMCESGRIVHHLAHAIGEERNTIVLIGFQAVHTLGRKLAERRPYVKIFDREFALKAHVERLEGLSAHADLHDFRWWFEQNASHGGIGQAFLVHGEPTASQSLAQLLEPYCDLPPIIPERGQRFEV
jgi:metallo-beta-lactamase family protein